jgi:type II secretory pathway component PulF
MTATWYHLTQESALAEGLSNLLDPLFLLFLIGVVVTLVVLVYLLRMPPNDEASHEDVDDRP